MITGFTKPETKQKNKDGIQIPTFNFYVAPGKETSVVMMSPLPIPFWEMNIKVPTSKWPVYEPTFNPYEQSQHTFIIKNPENKDRLSVHFTYLMLVVDSCEYTSKKGVKSKDNLKLLRVSKKDIDYFQKKADKNGGTLKGLVFDVIRGEDQKSSKIGTWESTGKLSELELMEKYPDQLKTANALWDNDCDLMKPLYMPKSAERLMQMYFQTSQNATDKPNDGTKEKAISFDDVPPPQDDDIPF